MDENHEAFGASGRVEEVESLPLTGAIGLVQSRPSDRGFHLAMLACLDLPTIQVTCGIGNEIGVGVGDIVFHGLGLSFRGAYMNEENHEHWHKARERISRCWIRRLTLRLC